MVNKTIISTLSQFLLVVIIFTLPLKIFFQENNSNIFLADPTIFNNNGTYYLYGTGGGLCPDVNR